MIEVFVGYGSPMRDADPDDRPEILDDDRLSDDYPPEQPLGVEKRGTTPRESQTSEPFDERIQRSRPEQPLVDDSGTGRLVSPDEGVRPDDEAQALARSVDRVPADDIPVGQRAAADRTVHETPLERG